VRKLSTAFLIAGVAALVSLAGCGGGGGGGITPPPPPPPGQVIITGVVTDNRATPLPVQHVLVKLNGVTVETNASGQFSFTLPSPPTTLIAPTDAYFYVSTRILNQTDYADDFAVTYGALTYSQLETVDGAKIPIPSNVYSAASGTVSLGVISVIYNDPNSPPPPPF